MTVVVAFLCSDGVVVAADSMLTPLFGGMAVGHHKALKVHVLPGPQLFAFAGDQGQAARFMIMAEAHHEAIGGRQHALDHPLVLTSALVTQFQATGVANTIAVNTVLAFEHGGSHHCCAFEGAMQPRLLDHLHFYVALGSGKLSADPFLRFLADIFCGAGQPNVRDAIFLATWTIQHVIDTNPGGVSGPIKIATLEAAGGGYQARALPDNEIAEHLQATESAASALRTWRDSLQSGAAAEGTPEMPQAPAA
jgi:20S proteasome alpha/beta subunit